MIKKHVIFLFFFLISLSGCKNDRKENMINEKKQEVGQSKASTIISDINLNAEGPFLFNTGTQIILNWTQRDDHDKQKNMLKFVFFNLEKQKFGKIRTVTPAKGLQMHAESMAKVGMNARGVMYAVYRKKSKNDRSRFGGKLYYTISQDSGKTWSPEHLVVADPKATSLSFYDIALLKNGELGMSWLDNRRKLDPEHKGKCLFYGQTKDTNGFVIQKPIAGSTCECCRTEIFVDSNGVIHVAYRNIIEPDEKGFDGYGFMEIRDMYYLKSTDNGKNFTKPMRLSEDNWHVNGCPHTGPSLAYNGQKLAGIWFTGVQNKSGIYYTDKEIKDTLFGHKKRITIEGRHPQMVSLDGNFYVVYEEYYEQNGKGYYKIVLHSIQPDYTEKQFEISRPLTQNNHPVIGVIDTDHLLVVWVNTDTRHPKIEYKIVPVKD